MTDPKKVASVFANAVETTKKTPWASAEAAAKAASSRGESSVTLQCSRCGAPQEKTLEFTCRYCGTPYAKEP